jgi:preprotein translocase subunit SecD
MLQFPPWKVALILVTLLWGVLMALPNVVNMSGAPDFLPKKGVNLGLDLRGGVYLEMEIRPEDVIGGRLEVFARDVRSALARTDTELPVAHLAEVNGRSMTIKLTRPDAAGNFRSKTRSRASTASTVRSKAALRAARRLKSPVRAPTVSRSRCRRIPRT